MDRDVRSTGSEPGDLSAGLDLAASGPPGAGRHQALPHAVSLSFVLFYCWHHHVSPLWPLPPPPYSVPFILCRNPPQLLFIEHLYTRLCGKDFQTSHLILFNKPRMWALFPFFRRGRNVAHIGWSTTVTSLVSGKISI